MIYKLVLLSAEGGIGEVIHFDVVQSLDESASSTVPSSPVEEGLVFDHSFSGNTKFSMSAIYTDTRFRDKGHLITYQNGNFVLKHPELSANDGTENRVQDMKEKLKDMRAKGTLFGLAECLEHDVQDPTNLASQVNFYFPCAFTELSFPYKDGSNAIYPAMSIEVIRVTEVQVSKIDDPSPQLIRNVKHGDQGNVGGVSGVSTDTESGDSVINQIKNDAKKLSSGVAETSEKSFADKYVENGEKKLLTLNEKIKIKEQIIQDMRDGKITVQEADRRIRALGDLGSKFAGL